MKKSKFIKKEEDLAEYEISGADKERFFNENGEEYKAEKIPERTKKDEEERNGRNVERLRRNYL